jgi:signal transduction histidine kinase
LTSLRPIRILPSELGLRDRWIVDTASIYDVRIHLVESEITSIEIVRERMVDRVLVALSIVIIPAIALSWARAPLIGVKPIMYFHTLVAVILCGSSLARKRLSFRAKLTLLIVTIFILGLAGLISFGQVGLGGHILMLLVVMTTAFLGTREGWIALGISGIASAGVALAVTTGILEFDFDILAYARSPVTWTVSVIGVLIFSGIALTVLGGIHDALRQAIVSLREQATELAAARDQAEAASRAKSVFLANVSHELRTPLNAILGFTQILKGDGAISLEHREDLKTVNSSGEHLLGMINDVLEMSKSEAGQLNLNSTSFDPNRLIEGLEDMFRLRATAKNLRLVFHTDPGIPDRVRTDEVKLMKVLINLLDNAIKFSSEGQVTLRAGYQPATSSLHFEVEDTGRGIPPEEIATLFDAFVQPDIGHRYQEGIGLGLPISREYVRLMNGKIMVSSNVGKGTTFTFDIRIEQSEQTDTTEQRADETQSPAEAIVSPTIASLPDWERTELPHDLYAKLFSAAESQSVTDLRDTLTNLGENAPELAQHLTTLSRQFDFEGIIAILAELGSLKPDVDVADIQILAPEDLADLPSDWLAKLVRAAGRADSEGVSTLLDQIEPEHPELSRQLADLVRDFQFEEIVALAGRPGEG